MTRTFKILTFQAAALAGGAFMLSTVAAMTHAAPAPVAAAVQIDNFTFKNQLLTVKPGTTVTWTNADDIPHTVVSKDGEPSGSAAVSATNDCATPGPLPPGKASVALGIPAKIRPDSVDVDDTLRNAASYVSNGERYRRELRRID